MVNFSFKSWGKLQWYSHLWIVSCQLSVVTVYLSLSAFHTSMIIIFSTEVLWWRSTTSLLFLTTSLPTLQWLHPQPAFKPSTLATKCTLSRMSLPELRPNPPPASCPLHLGRRKEGVVMVVLKELGLRGVRLKGVRWILVMPSVTILGIKSVPFTLNPLKSSFLVFIRGFANSVAGSVLVFCFYNFLFWYYSSLASPFHFFCFKLFLVCSVL